MFELGPITTDDKYTTYLELNKQAAAILADETNFIANAANFAALVYHSLPGINWAGFYLYDGNELVVGPFQGKPACIRIALGKGVCGIAAQSRQTQVVDDVTTHPNHIFCDSASRSEIVVPLHAADGRFIGVWDVDSPRTHRFDDIDRQGMEMLCQTFLASVANSAAA